MSTDGLGVIWECDNCHRTTETSLDEEPRGWLVDEPDEDDYPEDEEGPWDLILCAKCRPPTTSNDAPVEGAAGGEQCG